MSIGSKLGGEFMLIKVIKTVPLVKVTELNKT